MMLGHRIITALVLFFLMLGAIFYFPPLYWDLFSALIMGLVLWEYAQMMKFNLLQIISYSFVSTVAAIVLLYLHVDIVNIKLGVVVLVFWLVLVPIWLFKQWIITNKLIACIIGWIIVFPAWLALLQWRPSQKEGAAIFFIMSVVWVADIAAYAVGRLYGKHKLAVSISPGKTWEGALGAIIAVLFYVLIIGHFGWFSVNYSWLSLIILAILITTISIYGDLLESFFKRRAGMKDSGKLLPGHGGFYDRMDGLIAVLAVTAALSTIFTSSP